MTLAKETGRVTREMVIVALAETKEAGLLEAGRVATSKVGEEALLVVLQEVVEMVLVVAFREVVKMTSVEAVVEVLMVGTAGASSEASADATEEEETPDEKPDEKEDARAPSISMDEGAENLFPFPSNHSYLR